MCEISLELSVSDSLDIYILSNTLFYSPIQHSESYFRLTARLLSIDTIQMVVKTHVPKLRGVLYAMFLSTRHTL